MATTAPTKSPKQIQQALKALGIYKGEVDGIFGELSRKALREFQRMNGLYVDGIAGPKTIKTLFPEPIIERDAEIVKPSNLTLPATVKNIWPTQSSVESYYGNVHKIPKYLVAVKMPYDVWYAGNMNIKFKTLDFHEKVANSVERVLGRVLDAYGLEEIKRLDLDVCGGSYVKRLMRGGTKWSMHSYGIAVDWNPQKNTLRENHTTAQFAHPDYKTWWKLWAEEGWVGLGPAKDFDWMHIQAARV